MLTRALIPLTIIALTLPTSAAPIRTPAEIKAAVKQVRARYLLIRRGIGKRTYKQAVISIGGRQNPNRIRVHYAGGREAEYEKDPYASAPLRIHHIALSNVLPAVGPASVEFFFSPRGRLLFVHARGADLCGISGYDLRPSDQLRVYFQDEQAFRVIHTAEAAKTDDLPLASAKERKRGEQAGRALVRRARELRRALEVLGR